MRTIWQADWIYTGLAAPLREGCVVVDGGCVTSVCEWSPHLGPIRRLEGIALTPLFVNAHTHLEFSTLEQPLEPRERFADWIRAVVAWRRQQSIDSHEAIGKGIIESSAFGVGAIGEIATSDWWGPNVAVQAWESVDLQGVLFREILGMQPEALRSQLAIAARHLSASPHTGCLRGLSPHAPYSVHPTLFRELLTLAKSHSCVPVAMHLAESPAELELLAHRSGPLVELLREFGVWQPECIPVGTRPLDYLRLLATLPQCQIVHGNYLSEDEIDFLAGQPQMSVVYCPRTHAAMGHTAHPWRTLMSRGVNVAVGTDSRASNPDLSIWSELQRLSELAPELTASEILKIGTVNGAAALGLTSSAGCIASGRAANMACIALSADALTDPERWIFRSASIISGQIRMGQLYGLDGFRETG